MPDSKPLPCDGCGQLADPAHIARRLARLERTTRFRPIHIQTLFLAAVAPEGDNDFLYSPDGAFTGEAAAILASAQIDPEGKSRESVLSEFQKRGLLLVHVLECPFQPLTANTDLTNQLERQLSPTLARIRRSLKPKQILVLSPELKPLAPKLTESALNCPISWEPSPTSISV